jgi:hypothetical protein
MVAIGRDEHDHGNGPVCPGCRFKAKLAEFLEQAHSDGRQEWHYAIGDLRTAMHHALLALDHVEAEPYLAADDLDDADDDPAVDAAFAISTVGAEIEVLWKLLMQPDGQGHG